MPNLVLPYQHGKQLGKEVICSIHPVSLRLFRYWISIFVCSLHTFHLCQIWAKSEKNWQFWKNKNVRPPALGKVIEPRLNMTCPWSTPVWQILDKSDKNWEFWKIDLHRTKWPPALGKVIETMSNMTYLLKQFIEENLGKLTLIWTISTSSAFGKVIAPWASMICLCDSESN